MENEEMKKQEQDSDDDYDEEMDQIDEMSSVGVKPLPTASAQAKTQSSSLSKGGMYDPLEWDNFYESLEMICNDKVPLYSAGNKGHVILCLHGAGHSALSFAHLAKLLKDGENDFICCSFDFRGHGQNTQEDPLAMTEANLINDTIEVIKEVVAKYQEQSIIVLGHSLGGSIATKAVNFIQKNHKDDEWSKHIMGLCIIDVAEGSAMDALPFMESLVQKRPKQFLSLAQVVQYGITSNTIRDRTSARVSMPAQVVEKTDDEGQKVYEWKTDLLATKPYWVEWFKGLTQVFLDTKMPKQLLLAGSERMDKELTIAQMEGRFSMVVIEDVGHSIQEDNPLRVAEVLQEFISKFHIPQKYNEKLVVTSVSGKKVVIGS